MGECNPVPPYLLHSDEIVIMKRTAWWWNLSHSSHVKAKTVLLNRAMRIFSLAPRLLLIVAGVALGLTARMILGVPEVDGKLRELTPETQQAIEPATEQIPVLPVETAANDKAEEMESGIVPPVSIPGQLPQKGDRARSHSEDTFPHDPEAIFHSHGELVCASGCAASNHPTTELTESQFRTLLSEFAEGKLNSDNQALESLLFFGPQTRRMIEQLGVGELNREHAEFLWQQLKCNSVKVSLRVVDQHGQVRSWLQPTSVPYDRRHVFDMKTENLQSLVTSGTVKRVGLNHNWVRL